MQLHSHYSTPCTTCQFMLYKSDGICYNISKHVTQFEKHGAFELGNPPRMGQEFYVLATTTKKPRIIALYDTDRFEITQR